MNTVVSRKSQVVSRKSQVLSRATAVAGVLGLWLAIAPSAGAAFTGAERVKRVYDLILDARFDQAFERLRDTCPPLPAAVCSGLNEASLWWRILIDPDDHSRDDTFVRAAADAIASATEWTRLEPQRGEAWFYLGASYGPLVNLRALRGQRLAAARDGKKIKDALERALQLDPSLEDAWFGIGLYHYVAAVAPGYAPFLPWLLLLPGGDRAGGLAEMTRARERAVILRGEADFQLHQIYLWYENRPTEALALLESLDARYPFNPIYLERIAEAQSKLLHDRLASARTWQKLRDRARASRVFDAQRVVREADERTRSIDRRFF